LNYWAVVSAALRSGGFYIGWLWEGKNISFRVTGLQKLGIKLKTLSTITILCEIYIGVSKKAALFLLWMWLALNKDILLISAFFLMSVELFFIPAGYRLPSVHLAVRYAFVFGGYIFYGSVGAIWYWFANNYTFGFSIVPALIVWTVWELVIDLGNTIATIQEFRE